VNGNSTTRLLRVSVGDQQWSYAWGHGLLFRLAPRTLKWLARCESATEARELATLDARRRSNNAVLPAQATWEPDSCDDR
jgi:hypothetical protein